ncbi:MAG: 5'-methylthioadenosine/S-adenosylhomocysteine nucleosidase [Malacoplasma sp.]
MLAIIIALESEIFNAQKVKDENKLVLSNDQKFYLNENKEIVIAFSGVGKVNAANCISNLLKTFPMISNVINIGLVGCSNENYKLGSTIVVDEFYYLDVDATIFGYKYGQVPREDEKYLSSKEKQLIIKNILLENNIDVHFANIGTSDSFINKHNINNFPKEIVDNISLFDMESTAIAHVCSKNRLQLSSIKIVSDNIFLNTSSSTSFNDSLITYAKLIEKIVIIITNNINSLKNN